MELKIEKDEFELLALFVEKEIESYQKQLEWYKKHESQREEVIRDNSEYIRRLELLKKKVEVKDA